MSLSNVTIDFEYPQPADAGFALLNRLTFYGDVRAADAFCEACRKGLITRATITSLESFSRRVI